MHDEHEVPLWLGEFQRRRIIARGGMGEVWLAYKRGTTKPCVIKVLLPQYSRDPEYRRRFLREAEVLAQLRYCRIVPILDYGECNGWLYIVMEYIDGADLGRFCRALSAQGQVMPVEVVGYIAGNVFEALRHAHNRAVGGRPLGIIHRDITPGNVLISSEGEVFLTDFGLARRNADLSGEIFGTLEYMAPEQALGRATFQSDLYSVGGLIYFMLTGRPPRKARNAEELMINLRPTICDIGRDDVAEPLLKVMHLCLAPALPDRIASADDGIALLDSWISYGQRTTVTTKLYARYVGPRHTGLTDLLPAALDVSAGEAPIPRVGGTERVTPGGTVRVAPQHAFPADVLGSQAETTVLPPEPLAAQPPEPPPAQPPAMVGTERPVAAPSPMFEPEPEPPEMLWRPWWADRTEIDGDGLEEGITIRFVAPSHPRPRSLPPPHLAEPDAPRLFRRARGPRPQDTSAEDGTALVATDRIPPPSDAQSDSDAVSAAGSLPVAIPSRPTPDHARSGDPP